jgi:hypothetical protein
MLLYYKQFVESKQLTTIRQYGEMIKRNSGKPLFVVKKEQIEYRYSICYKKAWREYLTPCSQAEYLTGSISDLQLYQLPCYFLINFMLAWRWFEITFTR